MSTELSSACWREFLGPVRLMTMASVQTSKRCRTKCAGKYFRKWKLQRHALVRRQRSCPCVSRDVLSHHLTSSLRSFTMHLPSSLNQDQYVQRCQLARSPAECRSGCVRLSSAVRCVPPRAAIRARIRAARGALSNEIQFFMQYLQSRQAICSSLAQSSSCLGYRPTSERTRWVCVGSASACFSCFACLQFFAVGECVTQGVGYFFLSSVYICKPVHVKYPAILHMQLCVLTHASACFSIFEFPCGAVAIRSW